MLVGRDRFWYFRGGESDWGRRECLVVSPSSFSWEGKLGTGHELSGRATFIQKRLLDNVVGSAGAPREDAKKGEAVGVSSSVSESSEITDPSSLEVVVQ